MIFYPKFLKLRLSIFFESVRVYSMGFRHRIGEKLSSGAKGLFRIGKKVAQIGLAGGAAYLGAKELHSRVGEEIAAGKENVDYIAAHAADAAVVGARAGAQAAINPFAPPPAKAAQRAGLAAGGQAAVAQAALVDAVGNREAAQALRDREAAPHRERLPPAPPVVSRDRPAGRIQGFGSQDYGDTGSAYVRAGCQALCNSKHGGSGLRFKRCVKKCG